MTILIIPMVVKMIVTVLMSKPAVVVKNLLKIVFALQALLKYKLKKCQFQRRKTPIEKEVHV